MQAVLFFSSSSLALIVATLFHFTLRWLVHMCICRPFFPLFQAGLDLILPPDLTHLKRILI